VLIVPSSQRQPNAAHRTGNRATTHVKQQHHFEVIEPRDSVHCSLTNPRRERERKRKRGRAHIAGAYRLIDSRERGERTCVCVLCRFLRFLSLVGRKEATGGVGGPGIVKSATALRNWRCWRRISNASTRLLDYDTVITLRSNKFRTRFVEAGNQTRERERESNQTGDDWSVREVPDASKQRVSFVRCACHRSTPSIVHTQTHTQQKQKHAGWAHVQQKGSARTPHPATVFSLRALYSFVSTTVYHRARHVAGTEWCGSDTKKFSPILSARQRKENNRN